ncbi:MAG: class III poly(R)-hydroxyalkanoic acid synthase subunit PhaC [Syntrophobacterales bacterium]|jgi:polyhydroxyalkanoate synthase|nr:class III poly(R)-hydroxyalkanoic acid synthase subunit PhaC [Syntrophobacterales bacterium]
MARPDESPAAVIERLLNQFQKISGGSLAEILTREIPARIGETPCEIVYAEDRLRLKHYQPEKKIIKTPLLLVYALINRETMLDLEPDRSVIRRLLQGGVEIYMVDWGTPTRKDRFLTIDDHVNGYMDRLVDVVRRRHRIAKINMMGVCMGGTFAVMYSALHPEKIRNLITSVTPVQFDTDKGLLHRWMKELDVDRLVDAMGNISGDFLNMAFLMLNPARLVVEKYKNFFDHLDDISFLETFLRMEKWIFDSPDVPGETFRQYARDCYQKNLLIQNKMELEGQRVDLRRITMPVLNFYAREDHQVPPEASIPLIENIGTRDGENVSVPTGHIGIYVSSRAQEEFVPRIVRWLQAREPRKTRGE